MNTCRHQRFRQLPARHRALSGQRDSTGIDDGPRKLLDKEWHAVGSFHDLAGNPARYEIAARNGCDHLLAFMRRQLLQGDPSNGRGRQPVGLVIIAMRDQHHKPLAGTVSYHAYQQFDGGRVHPLDVLDDYQNRHLARGGDKNIDEHLKAALTLRRRSEIRGLVSRTCGYRQHRSVVTKRRLEVGDGPCQKRAQFCQCEVRVVGLLDAGRACESLDFRGKRRVDVERRALQRQNFAWRRIKGTAELADQT